MFVVTTAEPYSNVFRLDQVLRDPVISSPEFCAGIVDVSPKYRYRMREIWSCPNAQVYQDSVRCQHFFPQVDVDFCGTILFRVADTCGSREGLEA
jgi:hypothetical protein